MAFPLMHIHMHNSARCSLRPPDAQRPPHPLCPSCTSACTLAYMYAPRQISPLLSSRLSCAGGLMNVNAISTRCLNDAHCLHGTCPLAHPEMNDRLALGGTPLPPRHHLPYVTSIDFVTTFASAPSSLCCGLV